MMWEFWINRFQWGMMAKHTINPKNYYYAATLTAAQVSALTEEVDGKNRLESEQILISNLYLCLGEKGQDELHKRRPHLDLSTFRYPRMPCVLETEFKKERNETYETFQHLSRKQFIDESLEQFHSVLSGLAARCNFGALEDRILRDVFIVNMNNREAQRNCAGQPKHRKRFIGSPFRTSGETNMPHLTLQPPPRDPREPKNRHQGVESRSKQNRSGLYEENIVITVQGAEAHTKDKVQTGGGGSAPEQPMLQLRPTKFYKRTFG